MSNNRGDVYEFWINCFGVGFIVLLIILGIIILPPLISHLLSLELIYYLPIVGLVSYIVWRKLC